MGDFSIIFLFLAPIQLVKTCMKMYYLVMIVVYS